MILAKNAVDIILVRFYYSFFTQKIRKWSLGWAQRLESFLEERFGVNSTSMLCSNSITGIYNQSLANSGKKLVGQKNQTKKWSGFLSDLIFLFGPGRYFPKSAYNWFKVIFAFMIATNDGPFSYLYVKPVVEIDLVNSALEPIISSERNNFTKKLIIKY